MGINLGDLSLTRKQGVLYFQKLVKEALSEHRKAEQESGGEIWPARQGTEGFRDLSDEIDFCSGLVCGDNKEVEW